MVDPVAGFLVLGVDGVGPVTNGGAVDVAAAAAGEERVGQLQQKFDFIADLLGLLPEVLVLFQPLEGAVLTEAAHVPGTVRRQVLVPRRVQPLHHVPHRPHERAEITTHHPNNNNNNIINNNNNELQFYNY